MQAASPAESSPAAAAASAASSGSTGVDTAATATNTPVAEVSIAGAAPPSPAAPLTQEAADQTLQSEAAAAPATKIDEPMKTALAASVGSEIVVQARASLAADVGAQIELRVDGHLVGSAEVRSSSFANYVFPVASTSAAGEVDVVYTNDATINGVDRNLWVRSVTVNGTSYASTDAAMTYDIGVGAAAFDDQNTMPGQEGLFWNGSLRLRLGTVSAALASGGGYYVDQISGSDANPGSISAPFKTLRRLQLVRLLAGQGVFLKCGQTWRESLVLSDTQLVDGASIAGYGSCTNSSRAVISGADNFSGGWTLANGVWSRPVPAGTPQISRLTVNGASLRTARWPNHVEPGNGYALTPAGSMPSSSIVRASTDDLATLRGRDIVGATLHARTSAWMIETRKVSAFDANGGALTLDAGTKYPIDAGEGYVLEGKRWMLDAAGEFVHDTTTNTLYLIASDSAAQADLNAANVEGAVRDTPLTLARRAGLQVADIGVRMGRLDGLLLQDVPGALVERVDASVNARSGITLVQDQTKAGPTVRNSVFHNNWMLGIDAQFTAGAQIVANTVTATGTLSASGWSQGGINAGPAARVLDNTIDGSAYHGIRFSGANGSVVRGNTVTNYCRRLSDCGGIYTWNGAKASGSGQTSLVEANQVLAASANSSGATGFGIDFLAGIFLDDFSAGVTVRANLVYGMPIGIQVHNGWSNTIESNRVWFNGMAALTANMDQSDRDWMVDNVFRNNQIVPVKSASAVFPAMPTFQESYAIWVSNVLSGSAAISSGRNQFSGNQVVRMDGSLDGVHAWIRSGSQDLKLSSTSWATFNPADLPTATPLTFAMYALVLGPQLVSGGSFDGGLGNWRSWLNSGGSVTANAGAAGCTGPCITMVAGTADDWVASPGFTMKANTPYVYAYTARLRGAATLRFPYISRDAAPYDSMAVAGFTSSSRLSGVAGETIRYEGFFTAKSVHQARVNLQVKTPGVAVDWDNVSLRELQGFSFASVSDWGVLAYAPKSGSRTVTCTSLGWGSTCSAVTVDGAPVALPLVLAPGTQQLFLRADSVWRR